MVTQYKFGFIGYAFVRSFGWAMVAFTLAFVLNTFLSLSQNWPGVSITINAIVESDDDLQFFRFVQGLGQIAVYIVALLIPVFYGFTRKKVSLRRDAEVLSKSVNYFIRCCFWAVLFVGVSDAAISFLRVEGLLDGIVGKELATQLGRSRFRGPYVHIPLVFIGFLTGIFVRHIAFIWLALMVVVGELSIVITQFVFSYEQAFQGDVVRFWYAALFLFASAYTLFEDGHVRVDVLYTNFNRSKRGLINAIGSIFLGMSLCWTILLIGMWNKTNIIVNPLLNFESAQAGFGMYTKYWLASFLAVFAISMLLQFTSYFFESIADYNREPGYREIHAISEH